MTTPFDNVPAIYDRIRPLYPDALFDELSARLDTQPKVLELGPGTGQATGALLARGARITAVERGPNLATFLREKFASESLDVVNTSFDAFEAPPSSFDAVVAATSFHWMGDGRVEKSHSLLKPGGILAVIGTNQIDSPVDQGYFRRSDAIYLKHIPDQGPPPELVGEDIVPVEFDDLNGSGLFRDVVLSRVRWDQTYTTADYADLMRSYSNMQLMEPEAREALIAELCQLIDAEFGGHVTRPLIMSMTSGLK